MKTVSLAERARVPSVTLYEQFNEVKSTLSTITRIILNCLRNLK